MTVTPRARSAARFACVAACSYIASFIAGATSSGQRAASAALVSRLSASPCASFASVFAEAGAIRKTSALATSCRWLIGSCAGGGSPGKAPRIGSRANSLVSTGAPVIPSNEATPTKRSLVGVWMTRTLWPARVARRTSSSAL